MADDEGQVEDENAEGSEGEDGESEDGEAKGGKKKLLLIIVPIILLIGGGAGAYFTGMLDGLLGVESEEVQCEEGDTECEHAKEAAAEEHGDDKKADDKDDKKADGHKKPAKGDYGAEGEGGEGGDGSVFLAIPTMLVGLNTDDGTPRHLRLTVQLELEDPSDKAAVKAVIPRVVDQFQVFLREMRVRDLRGSAGIYRLQMELLWRVNQATDPIEIKDILFQDILIQ